MLRLSLLLVLLMGCLGMDKSSIFNTEPYVDTVVDEKGKKLLADTPRNWQGWIESIDAHIENEASGKKVSGGLDSWNTLWRKIMKSTEKNTENAEKYINYIIVMRRNEGLPELVFEEN